jgi:hypothetical protein
MERIVRMDGFGSVPRVEQVKILNFRENFFGLSRSANASKGSKTFLEWTEYKKTGAAIDPAFRDRMIKVELKLESQIQQKIDALVAKAKTAHG